MKRFPVRKPQRGSKLQDTFSFSCGWCGKWVRVPLSKVDVDPKNVTCPGCGGSHAVKKGG